MCATLIGGNNSREERIRIRMCLCMCVCVRARVVCGSVCMLCECTRIDVYSSGLDPKAILAQ